MKTKVYLISQKYNFANQWTLIFISTLIGDKSKFA